MTFSSRYQPAPAYTDLGEGFFDPVDAAAFPRSELRYWNERWAQHIGLDTLDAPEKKAFFHRFEALPDNHPRSLALRYHGHQFRVYNPQIGDGRGFLHAQLKDDQGRLLDLATKGSGQTPWSRSGDGRLTLKGAVREILATEMLEALGVYTSKTFAVYETGEALHRGDEPSPTRSAVLTRLGHSHIRFGMFQRQAYEGEPDRILKLVEHALTHYYPERANDPDPAVSLLEVVVAAQARLVASWMAAGFVHGVLNTDNLNITGESFDYGPWRFLPHYEPGFVAAYFDETGLYAYGRQPEAVFWALQQFAGALSLVAQTPALEAVLNTYPALYRDAVPKAFLARLGLTPKGDETDFEFFQTFVDFLRSAPTPWEGVFFDWFGGEASRVRAFDGPRRAHYQGEAFDAFAAGMSDYATERPARLDHAYFGASDPASLEIERVEGVWAPIAEQDDWSALQGLLSQIEQARQAYALKPGVPGFDL